MLNFGCLQDELQGDDELLLFVPCVRVRQSVEALVDDTATSV